MALDAQWRQLHTSNHMLSERAMVHSRLADWKTTTFGNCSVWYSGGTPDTSVDAYWNGDIPWITASSLHRFYLDDSERKITQTGLENGSRLMPANSIIFVVRGMSLKTEFRVGITKRPVAFGQDCKAIVAKEGIDPLYLANVLRAKAHDILEMVDEAGHGTGRLQTDTLKALEIPLPPFSEQRAIASILGALDDKIELNRRMNVTLEAMARAIFQSWFVDFDPVRAKAEGRETGLPAEVAALFSDGFVESEEGLIPIGWRVSDLGSETRHHGGLIQTGPFGSQLHAADYVEVGVPSIMPKDIAQRRVRRDSIAHVRDEDANRLARHRVIPGDIVYSRRGDVERHALIGEAERGWLCGTGSLLVRLGSEWRSPLYTSLHLDQPRIKTWVSQHAIGATMPNLSTAILSQLPILVPDAAVQDAFQILAGPLDEQSRANDSQNSALAVLRDTILPELVSGRLRVHEAQTFLSESVS